MVIESIDNIEVAYELGKIHNIEMPIVNTVYEVLYEKLDPEEAVKNLMTRDKKKWINLMKYDIIFIKLEYIIRRNIKWNFW